MKNYQNVACELMVVERATWWNLRGLFGIRDALSAGIAIALALTLSATARAATITVNSLADTGATGICVLRDAITAANTLTATNGCAAGTGNDTIRFSVTGTILLASTLPQITDHLLTINGPASPGIKIDGSGKVQVMAVASGATLNLNKLTIANGLNSRLRGGGIYNAGTLTVANSSFSGNSAYGGGGIANDGELIVTNSIFSGNSAEEGGGIQNFGTLTIHSSSFSSNNGFSGGGSGGAIQCQSGPNVVVNSTFSGNSAGGGGAIANIGGSVMTVTNSTFSANSAGEADGGGGGGIFNNADLTVTNSTFSGNNATEVGDGGGILNNSGTVTINNSTISDNNSAAFGGGMSNENFGRLTITNITFFGNRAKVGGGIFTIGVATFKSTIVAASSTGGNCSFFFQPITDAGYNVSDDSTCGFAKTGSANNGDGVNPMLDPTGLQHNGGPTQTIALLAGSPAIDAIPIAECTDQASPLNPIITDQRSFPRPDAAEAFCDIGAYEVQNTPFIPFSRFGGGLKIDPDAGVFYLSGGFSMGAGGSIDPTTQPVAFSVGSYAVRLPAGSFVKHNTGYVYQKRINGIFLCIFIKFTNTPGSYVLLANRIGGTLTTTTSPVPVTLTVGNDSGTAQMNAKFD